MNTAIYPLVFTDDEGVEHVAKTAEELALITEFVDDRDPSYRCRDAEGRRVRLIVWALQVVLAQTVPDSFHVNDLRVKRFAETSGSTLVEFYAETPLRALREDGEKIQAISDAAKEGIRYPQGGELTDVAGFHHAWMRAKVGKTYKP